MTAARGDRRASIVGGCSREMQYGRRSDQERRAEHGAGTARDDPRGWICSESADVCVLGGSGDYGLLRVTTGGPCYLSAGRLEAIFTTCV